MLSEGNSRLYALWSMLLGTVQRTTTTTPLILVLRWETVIEGLVKKAAVLFEAATACKPGNYGTDSQYRAVSQSLGSGVMD